jgi:uncharacterized damage-inducible protein DinB
MNRKEVRRISRMLQNTYGGAAWHGPSVQEVLGQIGPAQAFRETEKIHRICELVQHMIAWRTFALKRIAGDAGYEVSEQENWVHFPRRDESAWMEILNRLDESQKSLLQALDGMADEKLDDIVEKKGYTYYTLLHGVIQHDLYHLGEIALLARLV